MKAHQGLGTNLSSLTWQFRTCVLFILYNAFSPQSTETNIEISVKNKTKQKTFRATLEEQENLSESPFYFAVGKKTMPEEA